MIHPINYILWRKTWDHGERPFEQGEKQQQTQASYGTWQELNLGFIAGRQELSWPPITVPSLLPLFFLLISDKSIFQPKFTDGQRLISKTYTVIHTLQILSVLSQVNIFHAKPHTFRAVLCLKTKAKVITLASHKGHRQSSEPINTGSNYMSMNVKQSTGKLVWTSHDWFWLYFLLDKKLGSSFFEPIMQLSVHVSTCTKPITGRHSSEICGQVSLFSDLLTGAKKRLSGL